MPSRIPAHQAGFLACNPGPAANSHPSWRHSGGGMSTPDPEMEFPSVPGGRLDKPAFRRILIRSSETILPESFISPHRGRSLFITLPEAFTPMSEGYRSGATLSSDTPVACRRDSGLGRRGHIERLVRQSGISIPNFQRRSHEINGPGTIGDAGKI